MLNLDILTTAIENNDAAEIANIIRKYNLKVVDGKITAPKSVLSGYVDYWDKAQHIKKINLNSVYGILLNNGCRFFDKRLGQSITLTGRQIVKHMSATVNEIITGEYDHIGQSIIYGDTDSVYFSAYPILKDDIDAGKIDWSKDAIIKLYDQIGELVNESFPSFMKKAFHCPEHMGRVIKAGREIIGSKALFMTKKRYAVLFYDKEGKRYDVDGKQGKVKAMGLDLKRADTPKVMQDFLSIVLEKVLTGVDKEIILEDIVDFRLQFKERPGWEKGTPKRVNGIGKFSRKEEELGKANIPGHVRAGINWNMLKKLNGDNYSMTITDGFKVIVCKLKPNPMGLTSVAYPIDELRLPQWFKELPFDHDAMESAIIDKKLQNLIGVLEWDLSSTTRSNLFEQLFDFT